MSENPALSVVAPCFNEEGVLPEFLARVAAVLDRIGGTAEIVVVCFPNLEFIRELDKTYGYLELGIKGSDEH